MAQPHLWFPSLKPGLYLRLSFCLSMPHSQPPLAPSSGIGLPQNDSKSAPSSSTRLWTSHTSKCSLLVRCSVASCKRQSQMLSNYCRDKSEATLQENCFNQMLLCAKYRKVPTKAPHPAICPATFPTSIVRKFANAISSLNPLRSSPCSLLSVDKQLPFNYKVTLAYNFLARPQWLSGQPSHSNSTCGSTCSTCRPLSKSC